MPIIETWREETKNLKGLPLDHARQSNRAARPGAA
jgi:hypothetical protein